MTHQKCRQPNSNIQRMIVRNCVAGARQHCRISSAGLPRLAWMERSAVLMSAIPQNAAAAAADNQQHQKQHDSLGRCVANIKPR